MQLRRGEINLYVRSLEKASRFYVRALDFEESESGDAYRKLRNGDVTLTLFNTGSVRPAPATGQIPSMTMDLHTDDLDSAVRRIAAGGGEVSPVSKMEGGRHAVFRDLDGIGWELFAAD